MDTMHEVVLDWLLAKLLLIGLGSGHLGFVSKCINYCRRCSVRHDPSRLKRRSTKPRVCPAT